MKALFVGLGSIGQRHLKNLCALCSQKQIPLEVTALRATEHPLPDDVAALAHRQVQQLPQRETFDLAFITNPTHLHAITIGELRGRVEAYFIEKPVFDHSEYDLEVLGLGEGQKAYVAAPMRWTSLYRALEKKLPGLAVHAARAICSSYLPQWRAGQDYRKSYSAHKEQGGGVTLDLIHEWDYLYGLFGPPQASCNLRGKYSSLEVDSDDLSVYIAQWPSLLGELHLDYFGRQYRRQLELFCEEGTLLADFGTGLLRLPNGTEENHAEEANARYMREMEYFLNYALAGVAESLNSPRRALEVLCIALSAQYKAPLEEAR